MPDDYPGTIGHFNPTSGKVEPWVRCAYCNTHVLRREGASRPVCDCGKTSWSNGERQVDRGR